MADEQACEVGLTSSFTVGVYYDVWLYIFGKYKT
jgi:hypothetical protein